MSVDEFLADAIATGFKQEDYVCCECKASDVRLFRRYCSSHVDLKCVACSTLEQQEEMDKNPIADSGFNETAIGWRVGAVPAGDTWWGYTSVPQDGVDWWKGLPKEKK